MTVGISSTEVGAIKLPTLVTVGCLPRFRVLLWEWVWFFETYRKVTYQSLSAYNMEYHKTEDTKKKIT